MHELMNLFFSTYIKLFFVFAPFFALSMFLILTKHMSRREQKKIAIRVTLAVGVICTGLFHFGESLFSILGITLDSFRIGAGSLLFLSAISLVQSSGPKEQEGLEGDISVVPLAIPIIVGPAVTGTLMIMGAAIHTSAGKMVGNTAVLTSILTVGCLLYMAKSIERILGQLGLAILSKVTGLVLSALSAQIVFTGIKNFLS